MKRYIYLLGLIILISCEKDSNNIPDTKYYYQEIMYNDNLKIYGQWIFLYTYDDAGIAGGPGKIDPTYDYLEMKKYGIYGMIKDNEVIESGKIEIIKQDSLQLIIKLDSIKNDSNVFAHNIWSINFQNDDSLILYDASIGCGTYYNVYKREK
jgi:hypothetical protein